MKNNDETILEIIQGHKTSKWPGARIVKIFIASTKSGKDEKQQRSKRINDTFLPFGSCINSYDVSWFEVVVSVEQKYSGLRMKIDNH